LASVEEAEQTTGLARRLSRGVDLVRADMVTVVAEGFLPKS
jgi:hypothetical protein